MADDPFDIADDGSLLLRLHVQPGAGRSAVVGRHGDALKLRVAAPPSEGRANKATVALVASTFGVAEADVELVGGVSSRSKRVRVRGLPADDARRLIGALAPARPDASTPGNAGAIRGVR
ncbi:MAG: DUF167 domain-containing protein [Acidimicrobiales bacterium]